MTPTSDKATPIDQRKHAKSSSTPQLNDASGLRVGLTGGIASGKSTVAKLFAELQVKIIDADAIAREVVEPDSEGLVAVRATFGQKVVSANGELDRKVLRNIIFSDPKAKETLNAILHPLIRQRMIHRSQNAKGPYHILDIPLLVETHWQEQLDRVLVVDCTQEIQVLRMQRRDKSSAQQALNIIASQASRTARLAVADDVIYNNQLPAALAPQVLSLHHAYLALASQLD